MTMKDQRLAFDAGARIYESALLRFEGVDGWDVYNCSAPFDMDGHTYMYGRVEKRGEWASSWARLFERVEGDTFRLVPGAIMMQIEDPYVQFIHGELVVGGTHVMKVQDKLATYYSYFYRGRDVFNLHYFTMGPEKMKDIRLIELADGRVGVFSRPRGEDVKRRYGVDTIVGFTVIDDLDQLTGDVVQQAPAVEGLFAQGEWGGCNECHLLADGRIGVIGHKCYQDTDETGLALQVYTNVAFTVDPATNRATQPAIIGTRRSYPPAPSKLPRLADVAFPSGMVKRADGRVDLYSGLGDAFEGRITTDDPFEGRARL